MVYYDVADYAYEVMKKSTTGGVSGEMKTTASKTEADKFSHLSNDIAGCGRKIIVLLFTFLSGHIKYTTAIAHHV